jgi:hypothetical protein
VEIAFFGCDDPELEAYGLRLANQVSAPLRAAFEVPRSGFVPIGPDFQYERAPDLFLGRRGQGPLHVAWDTNLLIDYFEHGRSLCERATMPDLAKPYGDELECLQLLFGLWVMRDIRFHVLPRVLHDAKQKLGAHHLAQRRRALVKFSSALSLVESGEPEIDTPGRAGLLILPDTELRRVIAQVPYSDQGLVLDAVRLGANAFMTRDKGVLACNAALRPFGLLLASPGDLFESLVACGAFHCLWDPESYLYWHLPDQARITHLIQALPQNGLRGDEHDAR